MEVCDAASVFSPVHAFHDILDPGVLIHHVVCEVPAAVLNVLLASYVAGAWDCPGWSQDWVEEH